MAEIINPADMLEDERHCYFMKQALAMVKSIQNDLFLEVYQANDTQGESALLCGETPVGCVLVYQDKIVGSGMNDTNRSMNVRDTPCVVRKTYTKT